MTSVMTVSWASTSSIPGFGPLQNRYTPRPPVAMQITSAPTRDGRPRPRVLIPIWLVHQQLTFVRCRLFGPGIISSSDLSRYNIDVQAF